MSGRGRLRSGGSLGDWISELSAELSARRRLPVDGQYLLYVAVISLNNSRDFYVFFEYILLEHIECEHRSYDMSQ